MWRSACRGALHMRPCPAPPQPPGAGSTPHPVPGGSIIRPYGCGGCGVLHVGAHCICALAQPQRPPRSGIQRTRFRRATHSRPYDKFAGGSVGAAIRRPFLAPATTGAGSTPHPVPGGSIIRPYGCGGCGVLHVGAHCICALPGPSNHRGREHNAPGSGRIYNPPLRGKIRADGA